MTSTNIEKNTIEKGFKYRIYPNKTQINQIELSFKAKRYVWNYFLNINKHRLNHHKNILNYTKMSRLLTLLKKKNIWLKQCEKSVLQNTLKVQYETFLKFFKKECGFPKFKSYKNNYQSVKMNYMKTTAGGNIKVKEKEIKYTSTGKYRKQFCKIQIPKTADIRISYSRQYQGRIVNSTLSRDTDGKYYISLCCVDVPQKNKNKTGLVVGIDLGIKEFATTSDNKVISNPKYYRKYEDKLIKAQRKLSKRKKGSNNRNKQRLIVNRYHKKIYNCRIDFLQKLTTRLTSEYDIICMEDLNVSGMLQNHKLAKSVADASFFEFNRELEYKAKWYDKIYQQIDRFYPSSQLCSNCSNQSQQTKDLGIRTYICSKCGLEIDRDYNASINILNEGLRIVNNKKVVSM
ncbi:RNA-guided endonuclease TnpB family protein [Clostridium botulinum]|uniref:RNA-guided endonuclease TnpB family protein n=1 Tax=Clostridium botulinum TaxID=1491 RepID=UPI0007746E81|nr:RNA-guided endonuclease TnpB family protein [Clostridium botulinum]APH20905.1 transposase, IS605 OrfB family [Clostridium botulinum]APQ71231.1 transposase, IS605 OrfB family [Clostridium botulinum]MBN3379177.1 transposase [Clostridium botulinum]